MPDKEAVIPGLDGLDPVARDLDAVNCVVRRDGQLWGHNTDGAGFLDALRLDSGVDVSGKRCVVLGAGGAGRAVALALWTGEASEIIVVNRSADRAQQSVDLLHGLGRIGDPSDIRGSDVVVNATSIGMGDGCLPFDSALLTPGHVVVDIVYKPVQTPLLVAAAAIGARTVDGLGMLVHQAAHAFRLWTGEEPPVDAMRAGAVEALAEREAG
jgi:shikimate dehydrogenase